MTDVEKDAWAGYLINFTVHGAEHGEPGTPLLGGLIRQACSWAYLRRLKLDRSGSRLVARVIKGEAMTTQLLPIAKIHSNPFQSRPIDQAYVEKVLAPDIAEHGLLQAPLARPHPTIPGDVELAFGHHRLAAYQVLAGQDANGWGQMPMELADMDDRQMFERAIVENEKRKPTSPIEKAQTLKRYIAQFKVTQGEAGKLFDLDQSSVSNLLSLLDYPEPVQARVHDGSLPLRYAWMLRPIAKFFPERAANAAGVIARSADDDRERVAHETVRKVWESLGINLRTSSWAPDWVPDAVMVEATRREMAMERRKAKINRQKGGTG